MIFFKKLIAIIALLLLIAPPTFTLFSIHIPLIWITLVIGFALFFVKRYISIQLISFSIIFYLLFFYLLFLMLFAGQIDIRIVVNALSLFATIAIVYYWIGPSLQSIWPQREGLLKLYLYAVLLHSIIIVFFFIFRDIRLSLHPFLFISEDGIDFITRGWRGIGINAQSGETLAISHSIAFFCLAILVTRKSISFIVSLIYFIILTSAIILLNRIGLATAILGVILIITLTFPNFKFLKRGLVFIFALGFLATTAYILLPKEYAPRAINRSLEAIENYEKHGEFKTNTTSTLFGRMLFIPDVPILTGTGNFGRQSKLDYLRSDIGWVRLYNGSGIIGILLWFSILIFFITKNNYYEVRMLGVFLCIAWIIGNTKVLWILPTEGPAVAIGILIYLRDYFDVNNQNTDVKLGNNETI